MGALGALGALGDYYGDLEVTWVTKVNWVTRVT